MRGAISPVEVDYSTAIPRCPPAALPKVHLRRIWLKGIMLTASLVSWFQDCWYGSVVGVG